MLHINKFNTVFLFVFLYSILCFLFVGCNSQDKPNDTSSTIKKDSPTIVTPPITLPLLEDWHMFMYDLQLSGKSPDKQIAPPLQLLWKFKTGGPIHASPVIANGVAYIGSGDGFLYALNAKEWGIKWVYNVKSEIKYTAVVWSGRVYFGTRDNKFYALDANNGDLIWEFKYKGWMDAPPVVFNSIVYFGTYPTRIYMLDAFTGKIKSERQRSISINGIDYACSNGEFRPIVPQYNTNLWRQYTDGSDSYPVIANGHVYIGARNGKIHSINMATKKENWSYQVGGPINAAPAISNGILYATSKDGSIYAFANSSDETPSMTNNQNHGLITHDNAPVYKEKEDTSPLYTINDDTKLPVLQSIQDWYQVELPNKEKVWLDKYAFGKFEETDGVMFNTRFTGKPKTIHLIKGAEYPSWSPDGERLAMLRRTDLSGSYWKASELWLMDIKKKSARILHNGEYYFPHVSWSLDGRLLAFEATVDGDPYIFTADWQSGHIKKLVQGSAPAWSPVANQIAFRRRDKGYDLYYRINSDGSGGKNIARELFKRTRYAYTYLRAPSWSSDGTHIAFEVMHDQKVGNTTVAYAAIRIQNIDGERLKQIPTQHQNARQIRWAPNGSQIAYVVSGSNRQDPILDKRLHVVKTSNDSMKTQIFKHTSPTWSPKDNLIAYMEREDCGEVLWKVWIYDLDNDKKYPIARSQLKLTSINWMPDGNSLCVWHTSDYLQNNSYKPADTTGWIVPINLSQ